MEPLFSVGHRAGTTALSAARADAAAWGTALEPATRTVVALAVACFVAGEALGRWVHQLNADLAVLHRCVLVGAHRAEQVVEQVAATWAGLPLACFSVVELRTLARQQLGSATRLEGRRIAQANRRQLLLALHA